MLRLSVFAALAAAVLASPSLAVPIGIGTYELHNHPDGSVQPPLYGLRLDELINVTGGHDVFTFDFDHPSSAMWLDYTGSTVHIYGTVYGGRDVGSSYDLSFVDVWNVDFVFSVGVGSAPGDDDLLVVAPTGSNSGTITSGDFGSFSLIDFGDMGFNFRFGDEDDDLGHRGHSGISGWGWINHGGLPHVDASDWLFTAAPIPEPGTVMMVVLGALTAWPAARRRRWR